MIARKLPTRRQLLDQLRRYKHYKRAAAIAKIAAKRNLPVEVIEKILATVAPVGRQRKETTKKPRPADKIGVCTECGQEKLLARRQLQSVCRDCVAARKPNPEYEHTPEEFERLKAEARAISRKPQIRNPKPEPYEIPVTTARHNLDGRSFGTFNVYDV